MKIWKILPESIKRSLIKLSYMPEKVMLNAYYACANGKLWCPDKLFQKWDCKYFGIKKINFKNPQTYQEKLQWLKYYYHNPVMTQLVDKYRCREYIAEKIGEEHLISLIGKYDSVNEIDFDTLPEKFVLKCNHDSGSIAICKNKKEFDFEKAKEMLNKGLKRNQFYLSREWPYKNVKPCIICEKYLEDDNFSDIQDYKFFCFDGKVGFFAVYTDRHTDMHITYYYPGWEKINMKLCKYPVSEKEDYRPENFDEMFRFAEILSKGFPEVRVDFYSVNGKTYFGEMTFYSSGGRLLFEPDEYNYKFGEMIKLPPKMR